MTGRAPPSTRGWRRAGARLGAVAVVLLLFAVGYRLGIFARVAEPKLLAAERSAAREKATDAAGR